MNKLAIQSISMFKPCKSINLSISFFTCINKCSCVLLLSICCQLQSHAQSLSAHVQASGGGYSSQVNGSLSFTIGEPLTTTLQSTNHILTQGFQQPEVQVRTNLSSATYCPGASVSIPYTATGIISATNVFTAQLSNASGSFVAPVNIGSVMGNTSGTINAIIPLSTVNGSGYRVRVLSSQPLFTSPDNGANINIVNTCQVVFNLKLFLQGYYAATNSMTPVMLNQSIGVSSLNVDSITVELRPALSPAIVSASARFMLQTNGLCACNADVSPGQYYIVVKHRNAIQTWSAAAVNLSTVSVLYDFSTSSSQSYGNNQVEVSAGVWAMFSGDINQDENIDLLDAALLENDITNFESGYQSTDINGDGNVDLLDSPIVEENINQFVFSNHL